MARKYETAPCLNMYEASPKRSCDFTASRMSQAHAINLRGRSNAAKGFAVGRKEEARRVHDAQSNRLYRGCGLQPS